MRNKTGMKQGWAFTAMRGSYRPPSSMEMESHNEWISNGKLLSHERDDSTQKLKN